MWPGLSPESDFSAVRDGEKKIVPVWVYLFDQPNFPASVPFLESLFTADRIFNVAELLEIHQTVDVIPRGEAWYFPCSMVVHSPDEIACDAEYRGCRRWCWRECIYTQ